MSSISQWKRWVVTCLLKHPLPPLPERLKPFPLWSHLAGPNVVHKTPSPVTQTHCVLRETWAPRIRMCVPAHSHSCVSVCWKVGIQLNVGPTRGDWLAQRNICSPYLCCWAVTRAAIVATWAWSEPQNIGQSIVVPNQMLVTSFSSNHSFIPYCHIYWATTWHKALWKSQGQWHKHETDPNH